MKLHDVESTSENFYWFMCPECDQDPQIQVFKKSESFSLYDFRIHGYTKSIRCGWCSQEILNTVRLVQTNVPDSWIDKNLSVWDGSKAKHAYGLLVDLSTSDISIDT